MIDLFFRTTGNQAIGTMKKQLFLFAALAFSLGLVAQPANYAWIAEFDGSYGNTRTFSDGAAGSSFRSLTIQATSSDDEYVIEWNFGSDRWQNGSTPLNSEFILYHGDGASPNGVISGGVTSSKYYTFQIEGLAYSNRNAVVMETDNAPIDFHSTSSTALSTPSAGSVNPGQDITLSIVLSGAKSSQEKVFIRYSKDGFSSSDVVEATGTGSTWTTASATIPASYNTAGATVAYYAYTTTVSATSSSNHDLISLNLANNGGSNYSYSVNSSYTTQSAGSWSSVSTWGGTAVPSSSSSVTINHNVTLDTDATISGLTISSGTFTASDGSARTLTISHSDAGSATTLTNTGGTWANGSGGSTVVFSGSPGSGDAIHQTSGTLGLQNVTIEKSGGSDNVGVDFQANSSVSGTLVIGNGGYVSTSPPSSFYGGSATLNFNQGVGAEYDVGSGDNSWSTTQVPSNITISSGTVNLNDDRDATGALNISSGATLNVAAGKTLTLGASSTNGGDLFLKANSSGYAQLDLSDNTTLSNVTAEQYFDVSSGGRWVYMSTPVTTTTTNLLDPAFSIINYSGHSSPSIYRYDGSNYSAISSGTTLNKGDGFMIYAGTNPAGPYVFSAGTFTLSTSKGEITNQDVAISCTNSGPGSSTSGYNGASDGWNLVGNPFPQGLTNASIANANTTDFDGTIYGFNGSNFVSESSSGVGSFDVARPFQSFWVRRTSTGTSDYTLGYTNASTDAASFTKTNTQIPLITFSTTWQNGYVADNFVGFSSTATDAFDNQEDAFFLNAQTQGYANLFSFSSADEGLQIDMRNEQFQSKSIEMGFDSETNGTYSIAFAVEHIPSSWTLQLEDRLTNSLHDLNTGAYDFQHSSGNVLKRFVLHINKNAVGQEEAAEMENFYWFQKDQLLTVDGLSLKSPTAVLLTDMMGRQVAFRNLSAGTQRVELNVSGLNNGVYLLQLGNRTAKIVLH